MSGKKANGEDGSWTVDGGGNAEPASKQASKGLRIA